jgi:hypothetical protein
LDTAVAKTKLFSIGMTSSTTLAFPLKYVIQKCFIVDTTTISMSVSDAQVILFYIIYCTNNIPHHFFPDTNRITDFKKKTPQQRVETAEIANKQSSR